MTAHLRGSADQRPPSMDQFIFFAATEIGNGWCLAPLAIAPAGDLDPRRSCWQALHLVLAVRLPCLRHDSASEARVPDRHTTCGRYQSYKAYPIRSPGSRLLRGALPNCIHLVIVFFKFRANRHVRAYKGIQKGRRQQCIDICSLA